MARMYRMPDKDGVYVNPKTSNFIVLENVYMSQFWDDLKGELVHMPTATIEAEWIKRTHGVLVHQLEDFEYLGKL